MALTIIQPSQPLLVSAIITYLYADPGIGKTSLSFTADKAILFDFDNGAKRAGELRRGAVVQVQQWTDVANLTNDELAPFNTVVIDTVGAMLDCIKTHLLKSAENRQKDGALKLKAQGLANTIFKNFIQRLIGTGKDVVFIAHATEDEVNEQKIYRPDLGGKNRNELYRMADLMGYMTTVSTGEGKSERLISFKPSPTHHAKNSGALGGKTGEVWVPEDLKQHPAFLATLIRDAKSHINTLTPEQLAEMKAQEELANWQQGCEEAQHAGDLNQLTESLDKEHPCYKLMRAVMVARAKELGCIFDTEFSRWTAPVEFIGISDAQRDELQGMLAEAGIEVQTFCEDQGIDSLMQIEASRLKDVKLAIVKQHKSMQGNKA